MIEIFVSYRRADARSAAKPICDELYRQFGSDHVFFDRDALSDVHEWPPEIEKAITECSVMVVLIGPEWLTVSRDGQRRLDDPSDVVRREIETAIALDKRILPVLIDGAPTPRQHDLPSTIQKVAGITYATVGSDELSLDLKEVMRRVFMLLPKESPARAQAMFRFVKAENQYVVQYELTGLRFALEDKIPSWRAGAVFENIAPEILYKTKTYVQELFHDIFKFSHVDTPLGGQLFIPTQDDGKTAALNIAQAAKAATSGFYKFLRSFIDDKADLGFPWPIDLRIAVSFGEMLSGVGRNDSGEEVDIRVGKPLDKVQTLLTAVDPSGENYVKRGDVCLSLETVFNLDGFEKTKWSDGTGEVYLFRREPITDTHIRLPQHVLQSLKDQTLTADEKATLLGLHTPPSNYPNIARLAKTGDRICFIVGEAGAGKTLCALRLVSELMYIEGFRPNIPPIAPETWKKLKNKINPRHVIFLDDAFGKTKLASDGDFKSAYGALAKTVKDDTADNDEEAFLDRPLTLRPTLIVTMRQDIWDAAASRVPNWEDTFGKYKVVIANSDYEPRQREQIFESYWLNKGGNITPDFVKFKERIASRISYPMSLRDAAIENVNERGVTERVEDIIKEYSEKPLSRYVQQLENMRTEERLLYFFIWVYGSGVFSLDDMKGYYIRLAGEFGREGLAKSHWDRATPKLWGEWLGNGVFIEEHPLRGEALSIYFSASEQGDFIDQVFEKLAKLQSDRALGPGFQKLAAYAAAKIPGEPRRSQQSAISQACRDPDSGTARLLASVTGQVFREACAGAGTLHSLGSLRIHLVNALHALLGDVSSRSFGVAFSALTDGYSGNKNSDSELKTLQSRALSKLRNALDKAIVTQGRGVLKDQIRVQNIENAVWAIASNFLRLPTDYHDALRDIVSSAKEEWFRLRTMEAIVDYYGPIYRERRQEWAKDVVEKAVDPDKTSAYRRGAIGAWDANFDAIREVRYDLLPQCLNPSENDTGIGFLEWAIWTAGEHFDELFDGPPERYKEVLQSLQRLSRHEDMRVRKWLTTALAESETTSKNPDLRQLITALARDVDEVVRDQAVGFFFKEDG